MRISFSIYLLCILLACSKEHPEIELNNKSIEDAYMQNNIEASKRFQSIAFDTTNIDEPRERFKIVHISDAHLSAYSASNHYTNPNNLIESVRFANQPELRVNAILSTGDNISNAPFGSASKYMGSFFEHLYEKNSIPTFSCYGNHDCNTDNVDFSQALNYPLLLHHIIQESGTNEIYFYKDLKNPMGGTIRIISLNMLDQHVIKHSMFMRAVYSQEQIDWLGDVALKEGMTENHSILILNHFAFQPTRADLSTFLRDADFLHQWYVVPEIVEAFRMRKSIKKVFPSLQNVEIPLQVDFDFTNSSGDFICYLGGHNHAYATFEIKGYENESSELKPQQMILATNMAPTDMGRAYNQVERIDNTTSSNAFNLYALDTKERKLYITFFGAHKPKGKPDYPSIQVLNY